MKRYFFSFLGFVLFYCNNLIAQPPAQEVATPVEMTTVMQAQWEEAMSLIGEISAISAVQITSEVAGRIKTIHFQEGEQVNQGQLLVSLDEALAKATLDQAVARLALSTEQFERKKVLKDKNSITQSELDEALANLRVDEASVQYARASLEKTALTAPFAGKMGLKRVSIGEYITVGQSLVSLEATDKLQVDFIIPEAYLAALAKIKEITLTVPSLPGKIFKATIVATEPSLEANSRGLRVRAYLIKSDPLLKAGQFSEVSYPIIKIENALSLPETAVVSDLSGSSVYKIVDQRLQIIPVKIGRRYAGRVQILDGLKVNDQIVLSGQLKLQPGILVQVAQ